jgi:hypothetical protein
VSLDRSEVAAPYGACKFSIKISISYRFSRLGVSYVHSVSGAELLDFPQPLL